MVYQHVGVPGELSVALATADSMSPERMPVFIVLFDGVSATSKPPRIRLLDGMVNESPAHLAEQ